jgi:hypothetical protein
MQSMNWNSARRSNKGWRIGSRRGDSDQAGQGQDRRMGWKVIIAPSGEGDLEDIVRYIARHNQDAAARIGGNAGIQQRGGLESRPFIRRPDRQSVRPQPGALLPKVARSPPFCTGCRGGICPCCHRVWTWSKMKGALTLRNHRPSGCDGCQASDMALSRGCHSSVLLNIVSGVTRLVSNMVRTCSRAKGPLSSPCSRR